MFMSKMRKMYYEILQSTVTQHDDTEKVETDVGA